MDGPIGVFEIGKFCKGNYKKLNYILIEARKGAFH